MDTRRWLDWWFVRGLTVLGIVVILELGIIVLMYRRQGHVLDELSKAQTTQGTLQKAVEGVKTSIDTHIKGAEPWVAEIEKQMTAQKAINQRSLELFNSIDAKLSEDLGMIRRLDEKIDRKLKERAE